MILLKPNQISGEIMTLLDEADKKVIIVSPYYKIDKWYKLIKKLKSLFDRKIEIEFYVRDNEAESIEQVVQIGIEPICIPNLHAKLYMNEKTAVVTSMNLLLSSEINSLEIGYKTTTKEEYNELLEFYNRNLKQTQNKSVKVTMNDFNWKSYIVNMLNVQCGKIKILEEEGRIKVETKNNFYNYFIWNNRSNNYLRINGTLSDMEFDAIKSNYIKIQNNCGLTIELQKGTHGYSDLIWGTLNNKSLECSNISKINTNEKQLITDYIIKFILEIEVLKNKMN